jgi:hypothetical protein
MLFVSIVAFHYIRNIRPDMNATAEFIWHNALQWSSTAQIATGQQPTHKAKC